MKESVLSKKWEYLLEVSGDERQRELERIAKSSNSLDDWVRYRVYSKSRGNDPILNKVMVVLNDRHVLKHHLGLPDRFPVDLEGDYSYTDDNNNVWRFKVNKSHGGGGSGSRMKMACPMCGKYIGAAMTQYGSHLRSGSHGGEPKPRTFRQLWPSISLSLSRAKEHLGIQRFFTTGAQLFITAPTDRKAGIVKFMEDKFPSMRLHVDNALEADEYLTYSQGPIKGR
jgi:hypothetical protein